MYKHLILKVLTLLAITLYPFGHVFAQQSEPADVTITEEFGILTNDETGESFQIPVTVTIQDLGNGRFVKEYSADIPSNILDGKLGWGTDPTYSARAYIYMSYNSKYIGGYKYSKVNYYQGKWERLDPAVNCTKLEIHAACLGYSEPGQSNLCLPARYNVSTRLNPSSGTYYQYTPPWAGVFITVNDVNGHSGMTKVFLTRGGTSWTFEVVVCEGGYCL